MIYDGATVRLWWVGQVEFCELANKYEGKGGYTSISSESAETGARYNVRKAIQEPRFSHEGVPHRTSNAEEFPIR